MRNAMEVSTAPMTQLVSREMNSASAECISAARPYAIGTRITTVVMREIHIGVIVSPAPRITPERICVTAIAM